MVNHIIPEPGKPSMSRNHSGLVLDMRTMPDMLWEAIVSIAGARALKLDGVFQNCDK